MTKEQMKHWIDTATYEQLLSKCRFAPAGDPFFTGEIGDYYMKVIKKRRDADPEGHVIASKTIGWEK